MTRTYTKPTSRTQADALKAVEVIDQACNRAGICRGEWAAIAFENGCYLVERMVKTEKGRTALLQDIESGFWDWWVAECVEQDRDLINNDLGKGPATYSYFKRKATRARIGSISDAFLFTLKPSF